MVMRVTEGQISRLIYMGTQNNLANMARLQEMTSTGRRINSYADDPRGSSLTRHYESLLSQNEQYQRNINRARTMVESTDFALQDLLGVLRDAETIARREASAASSSYQTRTIGAREIDGIIQQITTLMNQTVEGNSLFAGHRVDIPPFVQSASGEVQYQGDVNQTMVRIGPNTEITVNVPGSELLGSDTSILGGFGDMAPRLVLTTSLSSIAHGAGWNMGSIAFTGPDGVEMTVDLAGAGTVGDVIDQLNAAGLAASIAGDGSGLIVAHPAGGPLTIRDVDSEGTATSLGIVGSMDDGSIEGVDIRANPDWTTNLAEIEFLVGAMPLGLIHLEMNGVDLTIDLSGSVSLDDIRTTFEAAVVGAGLPALTMEFDSAALNIASSTGETFTIENEPGDLTAENLGLLGTGRPARLFATLEALATAMRTDDLDGIRTGIGELEAIQRNVIQLEIDVGGRESMLEWAEGLIVDRNHRLESNLSSIRDADVIEVASELTQAETAYQASLLVSSKMMSMSLFDFI